MPPTTGFQPPTIRSRLMLEVASELVGRDDWPFQQAVVDLRGAGSATPVMLYGGSAIAAIEEVANGKLQFAIINPSAPATLALHGRPPFDRPIPLRAIACIPSFDQLAFAVASSTGLRSLREVAERRVPLRVSLRSVRSHSLQTIVPHALQASGFSLEDIRGWGGDVRFDTVYPYEPARIAAARAGELDAIFDEGVYTWLNEALDAGLRPLPLDQPALEQLETMGYRRSTLSPRQFPALDADVPTLDFSGFLIYTHADVPEEIVTAFCAALQARHDRIPHEEGDTLPIETMCRDTAAGPIGIPLHPAAERYWRERGYLA